MSGKKDWRKLFNFSCIDGINITVSSQSSGSVGSQSVSKPDDTMGPAAVAPLTTRAQASQAPPEPRRDRGNKGSFRRGAIDIRRRSLRPARRAACARPRNRPRRSTGRDEAGRLSVVARNGPARITDVVLGRARLEDQQHVPRRDLEGDQRWTVDQRPEAEQVAVEGGGAPEVAGVEGRFEAVPPPAAPDRTSSPPLSSWRLPSQRCARRKRSRLRLSRRQRPVSPPGARSCGSKLSRPYNFQARD